MPNIKAPVYDVCRDVIYEYIEQVGKSVMNDVIIGILGIINCLRKSYHILGYLLSI